MSATRALVTGGASGIGAATCAELVENGAHVAIADVDVAGAEALAAQLGGADRMLALACDVTSRASVEAAVARAAERFGGLEVLVNSAGVIDPRPTVEVTDEAWTRLVDIHLGGTMRASRAAYPHLRASGRGAIVSIASIAARVGTPLRASYCAAKAGIEGLTRALAVEWAPDGVRVNAVAPGYVRTAPVEQAMRNGLLDADALLRHVPMARFGEARELGAAVAFLASSKASFVTGQILVVDGGLVVNGSW